MITIEQKIRQENMFGCTEAAMKEMYESTTTFRYDGPSKLAVSYVKFYGQTLGGQSIESNELQYPIDVCDACLVYFPANAVSQNYCAGGVAASATVKACAIGQDQATDCQSCVGDPVCCPASNVFCGGTCCPQGQKCTNGSCAP